ncbi:Mannose-6-phosphate isomerase, cupin superfamily [Anaerovirgula multivorans]|uniref:Mannose-6-phosphate isomerase, cupin superfamily n=1 Tax=Anaerovirgula multivorans TaxID=312168 RepID=A0A239CZH2_9FIRM|nr:cupin domain-containing protein [Anaerovirgula multivorans]SNS25339.1 Mannose-6-phosphate isomerase, cupin superfamily [Anaerovirgula multivorans]
MIEKNYKYKLVNEKIVERIIDDGNIHLNHMVLTKETGLPEHYSNSNVYMIIIRGTMTLKLGEEDKKMYEVGDIINIPFNTKMNVNNYEEEVLEFFVVKSPNPKDYRSE